MSKNLFRCAIYTRKSTEEGLDQAFNSLDAQREACAAYVKSQASLGWKLISKPYDDGGVSGGTMERPALQELLEEIRAGRVDVVVVYKIDRLTRSLMDFARIVEVFDKHEVSFVSVVRQLFSLYIETGSVRRLKDEADKLGLVTPRRRYRNGHSGGRPFSRGHLYWLLTNPVYAGQVQHQGKTWLGQHESIIARELWEKVQTQLSGQAQSPHTRSGRKSPLAGLLFDETGDRLTPSHAVKGSRRYRYYISHRLMDAGRRDEAGWRLPAEGLERIVLIAITNLLGDKNRLTGVVGLRGSDPAIIRQALDRAGELATSLGEKLLRQPELLGSIVTRIVVAPQTLSVTISHVGLCGVLGMPAPPDPADTVLNLPFQLRRRGVEVRLVIAGQEQPSKIDTKLIETVAKAHDWMGRLIGGPEISVASLAREAKVEDGEISRVLALAFLAPDIVEAILSGNQPIELTARHLKRLKPLPLAWPDQRRLLGSAAPA